MTVDRPLKLRVNIPQPADSAVVDGLVPSISPTDSAVVDGLVPSMSANPADDALPEPIRDTLVVDGRTGSCEATERTRPIEPSISANPAYDALPESIRDTLLAVARELGTHTTLDFGAFATALDRVAKQRGVRLTATLRKQIRDAVATRDETAQPILVKSTQVQPGTEPDRLHGQGVGPRSANVAFINQYEPDPELRDTEQIPLLEPGGIAGFLEREVWPHVPDAWVVPGSERIGYEISFTRHFYRPKPLRTLAEIEADIRALEHETEGLLEDILVTVNPR